MSLGEGGIDAISVTPDVALKTTLQLHEKEEKLCYSTGKIISFRQNHNYNA
ncbi:MAG: hypothetical protein ACLFQ8_00995 [Candidatus Aenigmatarchaeota archaeon]